MKDACCFCWCVKKKSFWKQFRYYSIWLHNFNVYKKSGKNLIPCPYTNMHPKSENPPPTLWKHRRTFGQQLILIRNNLWYESRTLWLLLIFKVLVVEPYKAYSTYLLHKSYCILYWYKSSGWTYVADFDLYRKNKSSQK